MWLQKIKNVGIFSDINVLSDLIKKEAKYKIINPIFQINYFIVELLIMNYILLESKICLDFKELYGIKFEHLFLNIFKI